MFKALLSLFKKSDTKPPQAVRKAQTPKSKPKVASTRIGELGEHKINIQLDQLPKECKSLSDLMLPNPKSRTGYTQIDHIVISRIAYLSLRRKTTMEKLKVGERINNGQ